MMATRWKDEPPGSGSGKRPEFHVVKRQLPPSLAGYIIRFASEWGDYGNEEKYIARLADLHARIPVPNMRLLQAAMLDVYTMVCNDKNIRSDDRMNCFLVALAAQFGLDPAQDHPKPASVSSSKPGESLDFPFPPIDPKRYAGSRMGYVKMAMRPVWKEYGGECDDAQQREYYQIINELVVQSGIQIIDFRHAVDHAFFDCKPVYDDWLSAHNYANYIEYFIARLEWHISDSVAGYGGRACL